MRKPRGDQSGVLLPWPSGALRRTLTGTARLGGAGLLAWIGAIHLALGPVYVRGTPYIGVLFFLTAGASWLIAMGVAVGLRGAWAAGGMLAAGAFAGLIASVTVGLPGFTDSLSAPWATLALLLEGLLVVACVLRMFRTHRSTLARAR